MITIFGHKNENKEIEFYVVVETNLIVNCLIITNLALILCFILIFL